MNVITKTAFSFGGKKKSICTQHILKIKFEVKQPFKIYIFLPLIVRYKILLGARKWKGPLAGLTLHLFLKNDKYLSLLL